MTVSIPPIDVTKGLKGGYFHPRLGCYVVEHHYDWNARRGEIVLGTSSSADGKGVIDLFERSDPRVCVIITVEQGQPDMIYQRDNPRGVWRCYQAIRSHSEKI